MALKSWVLAPERNRVGGMARGRQLEDRELAMRVIQIISTKTGGGEVSVKENSWSHWEMFTILRLPCSKNAKSSESVHVRREPCMA